MHILKLSLFQKKILIVILISNTDRNFDLVIFDNFVGF